MPLAARPTVKHPPPSARCLQALADKVGVGLPSSLLLLLLLLRPPRPPLLPVFTLIDFAISSMTNHLNRRHLLQ
jgi:hypothetical protein